ncbi:MAG: ABC transporter ATP-binding protein [Sandaracinaceae bacterium]
MIVVDKVSKYYGRNAAVQGLDFTIDEGECIGFLGLNGAGKSTTLRLLSCLLLPTSGRITIKGHDAESEPHEIRKLIGYLPDRPPLYDEMRVEEFLRFAGQLRGMDGAAVQKRLPEVLERTGLTRVRGQTIETLSHGYKQRVGIAQAIVHNPALLILDEPIQGLDPVQIIEMRELIRSLRGEHTILLSSHILSEVERTCDRLLMLNRGRIAAIGSEETLLEQLEGQPGRVGAVKGAIVEVEVRGAIDAVRAALTIDGVSLLELTEERGVVYATLQGLLDPREEIARRVVNANLGLLSLSRSSSALEDAFVRMSKDEGGAS